MHSFFKLTLVFLQRHRKIEHNLKGFEVEEYIPPKVEQNNDKDETLSNTSEDFSSDEASRGESDSDSDDNWASPSKMHDLTYKKAAKTMRQDEYRLDDLCSQTTGSEEEVIRPHRKKSMKILM